MNVELFQHRLNAVENGLAATNENIRDFEGVARIQSEAIAELRTKSENLFQSIRDLRHAQQNDLIGTKMMAEDSDKRLKILEEAAFKKEGAKNMWHLVIDKFPSIVALLIFVIVITQSVELDKVLKLIGK